METAGELWTSLQNTRQPANTLIQLVIDIKVYTPLMGRKTFPWNGWQNTHKWKINGSCYLPSISPLYAIPFLNHMTSLTQSTAFHKAAKEGLDFLRIKIRFRNRFAGIWSDSYWNASSGLAENKFRLSYVCIWTFNSLPASDVCS